MATAAVATMQDADISRSMRRFTLTSRKSSTSNAGSAAATFASNVGDDTSNVNRRPSAQDQKRKPSLASISSKLRRSRKATLDTGSHGSRLGEFFLDLPAEIQAEILSHLATRDYLSLRLCSKRCLSVIQCNSNILARYALYQSGFCNKIAPTLLKLYPPSIRKSHNDAYFLSILHREKIVQRQIHVNLEFLQTRVYMLKLHVNLQYRNFNLFRQGLCQRFHQPIWIVHHLLDSMRNLIVRVHRTHPDLTESVASCQQCICRTKDIILSYPSAALLGAYHLLNLIILQLRSATRAPSFVGPLERRIRRWRRETPPDQELDRLILLGGLEEISKVNEMKGGYGERMVSVNLFRDRVTEAVRVNELAFPCAFESDPVLAPLSPVRSISSYSSFLAARDESDETSMDVLKAHERFLDSLTAGILASVPETEQFLTGPNSVLAERLRSEGLIEHENDLLSPYGYVQRMMAECDKDLVMSETVTGGTTTPTEDQDSSDADA